MKLSIITINFNNVSGLQRTMNSVLSQTWKDFEYIVIDGGSNDGSKDLIRSYAPQLSTWVSEKDSGIYNAMNKGIKYAKGEYCLFLNSGDFLINEHALERIFRHDFCADIVSFTLISTDHTISYLNAPPKNISLFTFIGGSLAHPSTLIRRNIFENVGMYDESKKIVSDWIFFIEALIIHHCSYEAYNDNLSVFDRSGISISSNNPELRKEEEENYLNQKFPRIWKDYKIPEYCANSLFFIYSNTSPRIYTSCFFPLKILNRFFHLRNRLKKRLSCEKISLSSPFLKK